MQDNIDKKYISNEIEIAYSRNCAIGPWFFKVNLVGKTGCT